MKRNFKNAIVTNVIDIRFNADKMVTPEVNLKKLTAKMLCDII